MIGYTNDHVDVHDRCTCRVPLFVTSSAPVPPSPELTAWERATFRVLAPTPLTEAEYIDAPVYQG